MNKKQFLFFLILGWGAVMLHGQEAMTIDPSGTVMVTTDLEVAGSSILPKIYEVTANRTIEDSELSLTQTTMNVDANSDAVTVTFPAAAAANKGKKIIIIVADNTNKVSINDGTGVIEECIEQDEWTSYLSDGSSWKRMTPYRFWSRKTDPTDYDISGSTAGTGSPATWNLDTSLGLPIGTRAVKIWYGGYLNAAETNSSAIYFWDYNMGSTFNAYKTRGPRGHCGWNGGHDLSGPSVFWDANSWVVDIEIKGSTIKLYYGRSGDLAIYATYRGYWK